MIDKTAEDSLTLHEFSICTHLLQIILREEEMPPNTDIKKDVYPSEVISITPIDEKHLKAYELIFLWLDPDVNQTVSGWKFLSPFY